MLFSIICLSRKFSVSCKRLFETRYFSATDWKQTVAFSLPTILYKNVTTRWIRSLHHFNPTPCKERPHMPPRYAPSNRSAGRALPVTAASSRPEGSAIVFQKLTAKLQAQKKVRPFDLTLKRRLPTLPRENRSTIGVSELNFSVRNGKRWDLTAITT